MWPIALDYYASVTWSFALALLIALSLLGLLVDLPEVLRVATLLPPAYTGMVLATVCLLQFAVSVSIDRRYEPGLGRALFWVIWYPLAYWMICLVTNVWGCLKAMLQHHRRRARWESPDRGIEVHESW